MLLVIFTMGSADTAVRYNDLGHKMMCVCGCGQILIECNHLGCPDSDGELTELRTALSHGREIRRFSKHSRTSMGRRCWLLRC